MSLYEKPQHITVKPTCRQDKFVLVKEILKSKEKPAQLENRAGLGF